ncbi:MAG: lysoplasmalogenase [Anaerolineae bacterium]|nr:lysoplasmalogenase [Anaerolineae bacterium]
MPTSWLPIPLLVLVLLLLLREETRPVRNLSRVRVWKPLATALVALIAALSLLQPIYLLPYTLLVLAALLASLVGDWLQIEGEPGTRRFVGGMAAFAAAHLLYIVAFTYAQTVRGDALNLPREVALAAVIGLLALVVYVYLRPSLGGLARPVLVYITMLCLMVHRAIAGVEVGAGLLSQSVLVGAGAVLFYISDLMLAINTFAFGGEGRANSAWVLSTYYCAQLFFALSASAF